MFVKSSNGMGEFDSDFWDARGIVAVTKRHVQGVAVCNAVGVLRNVALYMAKYRIAVEFPIWKCHAKNTAYNNISSRCLAAVSL